MPIYAYKCEACGHSLDVLRKISDEPLTICPQCNAAAFRKQVTAAGFQLKGSGWYVTDFRNGSNAKADSTKTDKTDSKKAAETEVATGGDTKTADKTVESDTPKTAAPASPAPGPAASS